MDMYDIRWFASNGDQIGSHYLQCDEIRALQLAIPRFQHKGVVAITIERDNTIVFAMERR